VITYRDDRDVDLTVLCALRAACDFAAKPPAFLAAQIDGAGWLVHAYDATRLVGFARAISDGVSNAYVGSVMVDPAYRRRGIGRAMIERFMAGRPDIKFVLHTRTESAAFYTAIGFEPATGMMVRERR
jgi:ribosomal protein S18 acetylase RimI-like enzyme